MANVAAICNTFKRDILQGLHNFGVGVVRGATTKDTFNAALYLASGSQGASTTAYSATNEVSGTGYSAGGIAVTNGTAPSLSTNTAIWTPDGNLAFGTVTLTTAFDCCTIYNNTASGKNAVGVYTFGSQTVTAAPFTLTMPVNDATHALIQIN